MEQQSNSEPKPVEPPQDATPVSADRLRSTGKRFAGRGVEKTKGVK